MNEEKLMEVAKIQEIPAGNMYHVEIDRKEGNSNCQYQRKILYF